MIEACWIREKTGGKEVGIPKASNFGDENGTWSKSFFRSRGTVIADPPLSQSKVKSLRKLDRQVMRDYSLMDASAVIEQIV